MTKDTNKKTENESQKLYEIFEERMAGIHKQLANLYCPIPSINAINDEGTANVVHGVRRNLWYLQDILIDLLIEEEKPKQILRYLKDPPSFIEPR
jgi:hypothetical protein